MPSVLEAALEYVQRGWAVFPLHGVTKQEDGSLLCTCRVVDCPDAGKHPITRRSYKEASKDAARVTLWFELNPDWNVGIATGQVSGITIIDVDIGDGKKGDQTWGELTREKGEPQTLMARTGGGGIHVFFRYNSALKTSSNTLGEGVDCRNDDGYIVGVPSKHRSGGIYEWIGSEDLADVPSHLLKKKETSKEKKAKKKKKQYSLNDVRSMLEVVPSDDRDLWRMTGIILGREFERSDEAFEVYTNWSDKWGGQKGRNHDEIMHEAFYELSADEEGGLTLGTIIKAALENGWVPKGGSVPIENFLFFAEGNEYIYRPTRKFWTSAAVDSACSLVNNGQELVKASDWLRQNSLITSMTEDPVIKDEVLKEHDCLNGMIVPAKGGSLFNAYRTPTCPTGNPEKAGRWLEHIKKIFPRQGDADQFMNYLAHRAQYPGQKPRFALVLVGEQGVGKDTAIAMAGPTFGEWNVESIDPKAVDGSFNEFCAKVLIVVSEASNTQDMSKWTFNERMKVLIAGTPDFMTCNPKYGHKFSVRLHCGVIITTNHLNGLYIPPDDRRYDVLQCPDREALEWTDDDVRGAYFRDFWKWYLEEDGAAAIAGVLRTRDISRWDANAGQRKTDAHKAIVVSGYDGDSWLLDALVKLGSPAVVTFDSIWEAVSTDQEMTKKDVKGRIGHVMPRVGFTRLRNPNSEDGRWQVGTKATAVWYKAKMISEENAMDSLRNDKIRKEAF